VSVLAIDTATRSRVVVALASADGTRIDGVVLQGQAVGTLLPRAVAPMLPLARDAIVVVTGPGTYTGVRAGMAAALGIAQALDLPLYGIGALEVVACFGSSDMGGDSWVVSDAGRGALYVARRADAEHPQRVAAGEFHSTGRQVSSTETLAIEGLVVVDPVVALAASVARALSRKPLDRDGLTALYVD
jgi:tRNA threonylcarbamoyl adenosine modification protein YeaZ